MMLFSSTTFLLLSVFVSGKVCAAQVESSSESAHLYGGGFIPPSPHRAYEDDPVPIEVDGKTTLWTAAGDSPINIAKASRPELKVFCWAGLQQSLSRLWYTACLLLDINEDSFHLYKGQSAQEVQKQFKSSSRWFALLPWRDRVVRLNGFSPTCLGVSTSEPYTVQLKVWNVDPYRFAMFIGGLVLIMFARKMSRNVVFHYTSGISVALVGSLLVAIFLISRLIPRKTAGATFLIGGWAVVLYILQTVWKNFREMLIEHLNYVIAYFISVSVISFVLIYRFGGIHNPKTMDIIQWGLQLTGAALVYLSCTIESAGVALAVGFVLLDLLMHNSSRVRQWSFINRFFPPKPRKLLTKEEYDDVGRRETQKELAKLREYARSPDCKSWDLVTKLKTPTRFGAFVEEGVHLTADEVDSYGRDVSFDDTDGEEAVEQAPVNATPAGNGLFRSFASRLNARNSATKTNGHGSLNVAGNLTDDEDEDNFYNYRSQQYTDEEMDYS